MVDMIWRVAGVLFVALVVGLLLFLLAWGVGAFIAAGMYDDNGKNKKPWQ